MDILTSRVSTPPIYIEYYFFQFDLSLPMVDEYSEEPTLDYQPVMSAGVNGFSR
jgi:hypothetical protein